LGAHARSMTTAAALYSTFVIDVGITAGLTNPEFE
jgi:hypothetical protein